MEMCPFCKRKASVLCQRLAKRWVFDRVHGFYRLKNRARVKYKSQTALVRTCRSIFPDLDVFQEIAFPDLVSDKGAMLRYDICIPELSVLIEYHGCTHFVKFIHRKMSNWKRSRYHDKLKKLYAKDNDWNLVIFTHRINIENESIIRKRIFQHV